MFTRFILVCFILSAQVAIGQSRYNFFAIGMEQGLSNRDVWSINQDKYGYIWIGTANGLNRYDGHTIKQYLNNPTDKHSIPGNTVYWIFKDSDGDMWFACGHNGLARYNYAKDQFESLPAYDSSRKHNRYNAPIWRFGEDKQKRIYLSSGAACYRYDKRSGKFEELTALFNGQLDDGIGRFIMEGDDIMWMATDVGLFRYDMKANKIRKIEYDVEKLAYGIPRLFDAEFIKDDELLLTTERAGYIVVNTKTFVFRPADAPYNPANSGKFSQMGDVLKDSRGRCWLTSSMDGLIEYFPATGQSVSVKKEPLYPYPYPEQEGVGKAIFEDRDGNIWYGTSTKGVVRFQPGFDFLGFYKRDYAQTHSLPGSIVTSFFPAGKDRMWIGTEKGLCQYNKATNTYTNYPSSINLSTNYPAPFIRFLSGNGDSLFIATYEGFNIYNAATNIFKRYFNRIDSTGSGNYSLFNNTIVFTVRLPSGDILLVNDQAGRFNPATGRCYHKQNTPADPLYDLTGIDAAAVDASANTLWIEAYKNELYAYNLATGTIAKHNYFNGKDSTGDVQAMTTDENGHVWIGTSTGVVYYDPVARKTNWFPFSPGSGSVRSIICQGNEWVWFTKPNTIGRLNRATNKIEHFNTGTVLPNTNITRRSIRIDASGNCWIGTDQGYLIVDTKRFHTSNEQFTPQLVSVKIFDKTKYFDQPVSDLQSINLRYRENFFTFEFSAFNFSDNKSLRYAYMLEGFDKDWNYTNRNVGSYTNVPSGKYKLRIRVDNGSDGWYEMKGPVTIHISPPFWKTPWFIGLSLLLIAGFIYLGYRRRRQEAAKKKIDKTIDYFANSVYGENSVNEICWDIARNCISQLQFEDCVVYLVDEKNNKLVQKAAYGPKNPRGHEIVNPIEIDRGKGIVGAVASTGRALLIRDTTKDARYIVDDEARLSEISVPILHDGKVIGVIDSEHPKKNFFTEEHLKALTTIASISANKIAEAQAQAYAKENEIKLLEINKMLAESQLMALRAQMNPHFVFNCLNSIQECIVTQKYGEASKYLNKFSKLFRMVLNNSGKKLVTLDEEKEVLQLYLELEQMRFENSFAFSISQEEGLESDEILIPSMLLQPYVENALWHGLMHKQDDRQLSIVFSRISDDIFRCVIDDNGIGREQSYKLKAQQSKSKRHESKGLKISGDRIEVLRKQGYHASLVIRDKYEAGQPTGTTVIIELSTFLKN